MTDVRPTRVTVAVHPYRRPAERLRPAPAVRTRPIAAAFRFVVSVLAIVCMFGLLYGRTHSVLVTGAVVAGIFTALAAFRLPPPP